MMSSSEDREEQDHIAVAEVVIYGTNRDEERRHVFDRRVQARNDHSIRREGNLMTPTEFQAMNVWHSDGSGQDFEIKSEWDRRYDHR